MGKKQDRKVDKIIGANLREFRREARVSQIELAERLGLHQTSICRIERGSQSLTAAELRSVAEIFQKPMEWMFLETKTESAVA